MSSEAENLRDSFDEDSTEHHEPPHGKWAKFRHWAHEMFHPHLVIHDPDSAEGRMLLAPRYYYIYPETRRSPEAVLHVMKMKSATFVQRFNIAQQAALAILAGFMISFGALLSVFISIGVAEHEGEGVSNLLTGIGFWGGFAGVHLLGAALFTEINVIVPIKKISLKANFGKLLRFWVITYAGNLVGAILVGLAIAGADALTEEATERLDEIVTHKLRYEGATGWFKVVLSGIMGNFLVGIASYFGQMGLTVTEKIAGVGFPVLMFVAIGVMHSTANMGYFMVALLSGGTSATWYRAFVWNIIPASLGNLIGGVVFVAMLMYFIFGVGVSSKNFVMIKPNTGDNRPRPLRRL